MAVAVSLKFLAVSLRFLAVLLFTCKQAIELCSTNKMFPEMGVRFMAFAKNTWAKVKQ